MSKRFFENQRAIANQSMGGPFLLRNFFIFALVLALACCTRAPDLVGVQPEVPTDTVSMLSRHQVFIATSRASSDDTAQFYSGSRAPGVRFASVDVTIPPNHKPGQIERAKNVPPDPRVHFTVENPNNFSGSQDFENRLTKALRARPPKDRNVLLFIHGYNTTLTDGVLQLAQFIEDSDYSGIPILFSWASAGKLTQYAYDLNSVLVARDSLVSMLEVMENANIQHYDVMAHSMGTLLTMEAGRQIAITRGTNPTGKARNVVLAAPDIDYDLFVSQISRLPPQYRSFVVLVSKDDKALAASRKLAGGVTRIGAVSAEALSELGVNAFDLSEIDDQTSLSHSKFKDSPEVVQTLGEALENRSTFGQGSERRVGGIAQSGTDGVLSILGF